MRPGNVMRIACQRQHMCSVNHKILCTQSRTPARFSYFITCQLPQDPEMWYFPTSSISDGPISDKGEKNCCLWETWRDGEGTKLSKWHIAIVDFTACEQDPRVTAVLRKDEGRLQTKLDQLYLERQARVQKQQHTKQKVITHLCAASRYLVVEICW